MKKTSSVQESMHEAARRDDAAAIMTMLDKGADIDAALDSMTPLHTAVENSSFNAANVLLKHGAEPNAKNDLNSAPLHFAKNAHIVKILLDNGAEPDIQDFNGTALLHITGDTDVVKLLLKSGTDPNITAGSGRTPLHTVKDPKIAKILLDNGADPNIVDIFRQSPLHYAPSLAINQLLLENGANPNWHDQTESTPLLRQLETDKSQDELYSIIKDLVKAGLKVNKIAAQEMRRSIEICDRQGYSSIKNFLMNAHVTWWKKLLHKFSAE